MVEAFKLLEIQRNAMLMYTSCGWFFSEISGIETVQIMKYAARAIQLANEFIDYNIEEKFLNILAEAKSNILEYGSGKDIYYRWVKPSVVNVKQLISHWAITSLYEEPETETDVYCWKIKRKDLRAIKKSGEFDENTSTIFTRKQTTETKQNPDKYTILVQNQNFDYLDEDNHFYEASYRFVRIRIDGKDEQYETIITNLPSDKFTSSDIKELYKLRWDIEVSYRHLKYSVNLNALHSRRRDFIKQEIWARMIMFNISMIIIEEAYKLKYKKKDRKYEYKINIARAIHLIRDSITKRKGGAPPDLLELIAKEILPIRPGRSFERKTRGHSFVSFGYRFN